MKNSSKKNKKGKDKRGEVVVDKSPTVKEFIDGVVPVAEPSQVQQAPKPASELETILDMVQTAERALVDHLVKMYGKDNETERVLMILNSASDRLQSFVLSKGNG